MHVYQVYKQHNKYSTSTKVHYKVQCLIYKMLRVNIPLPRITYYPATWGESYPFMPKVYSDSQETVCMEY